MILEQPSVRFEAIHSILSSDGNILAVSELCEIAGYPGQVITGGCQQPGQGKSGKPGAVKILNWPWRHTATGDTKKVHEASICPCCIETLQW